MTERMGIGALADLSDCSVPTIRYYEQIGLMPKAKRRLNGHRYYAEDDLERLTFIKRCRDLGFAIEHVRSLVKLVADGGSNCGDVRALAAQHLQSVQAKLRELREFETVLERFVTSCTDQCAQGTTRDCAAMLDLKAPAQHEGNPSCCGR